MSGRSGFPSFQQSAYGQIPPMGRPAQYSPYTVYAPTGHHESWDGGPYNTGGTFRHSAFLPKALGARPLGVNVPHPSSSSWGMTTAPSSRPGQSPESSGILGSISSGMHKVCTRSCPCAVRNLTLTHAVVVLPLPELVYEDCSVRSPCFDQSPLPREPRGESLAY